MSHYRGRLNSLAVAFIGAIAAVFDKQALRVPLIAPDQLVKPGAIGYFGAPDLRRHNRGGTAAAKRAALKRRNVLKNRRAHRAR